MHGGGATTLSQALPAPVSSRCAPASVTCPCDRALPVEPPILPRPPDTVCLPPRFATTGQGEPPLSKSELEENCLVCEGGEGSQCHAVGEATLGI